MHVRSQRGSTAAQQLNAPWHERGSCASVSESGAARQGAAAICALCDVI